MGEIPRFALYRQKGLQNELAAGENSSGFTNKQSPQGGSFSGDSLDQKKSKSPLFPGVGGGGGAWLQMTSALHKQDRLF